MVAYIVRYAYSIVLYMERLRGDPSSGRDASLVFGDLLFNRQAFG